MNNKKTSRVLRKCSVLNCTSIHTDGCQRRIPMYKFPDANADDFQAWLKSASPYLMMHYCRERRIYICALHFTDDDFEQNEIRILKDGEEVVKGRTVHRLKKCAVPTIFPSNPMPDVDKQTLEVPKPIKPFCVVQNCPGKDADNIKLFSIPLRDAAAWCRNLRIEKSELNICTRVCIRHFEKSSLGWENLRRGARPTLNLGHPAVEPSIVSDSAFKGNIRFCCIADCHSKNPPDLVFSFPSDMQRLKSWSKICWFKPGMKVIKQKYICEKHFHSSMMTKKDGKFRLLRNATPIMQRASVALVENPVIRITTTPTAVVKSLENIGNAFSPTTSENSHPYFEIQELDMNAEEIQVKNEPMTNELESEPYPLMPDDMNEFIKTEPMESENDEQSALLAEQNSLAAVSQNHKATAVECKSCVKLLADNQFCRERCLALESELQDVRAAYAAFKVEQESSFTHMLSKNHALRQLNESLLAELKALKK